MRGATAEHRLEGLEPDNLLAFLALLGLLRALEEARLFWRPRVRWSLEQAPLRPVLVLRQAARRDEVLLATGEGLAALAVAHDFGSKADLNHPVHEAREALAAARTAGGYAGELATALLSDAAVKVEQGKRLDQIEATPLCLLFGQGHQHFLTRLCGVPRQETPPPRGRGNSAVTLTSTECLAEALFQTWLRHDPTFSFRWDPAEDVRYALMYGDPSLAANKEGTQHGANRLAAVGLSALTVVPVERGGKVRLSLPGGTWAAGFSFAWPIMRDPASLTAIRAVLSHRDLANPVTLGRLGVDHIREARRISVGKFLNFTMGRVTIFHGFAENGGLLRGRKDRDVAAA
jgi:hypothetical protein